MSKRDLPIFKEYYKAVKKLGKGGNGDVYKVIDLRDDSQIAIKKLTDIKHTERIKRFKNEITALMRNSDVSGVMKILDYDLDSDIKWYAMPIATPLEDHSNILSVKEILKVYGSYAVTLHKLHERGISHRDIKPPNLFISGGQTIIGDFGLVKLPDSHNITPHGKKLGPSFYIAPEMLNNPDKSDGAKADVYSLAKSLWCSLTKQPYPIPGEHSTEFKSFWVSNMVDKELGAIDYLLLRSMYINPERRLDMLQFANEINQYLVMSEKKETDKFDLHKELKKLEPELSASNQYKIDLEKKTEELLRTIFEKFKNAFGDQIDKSTFGNNIGISMRNASFTDYSLIQETGRDILKSDGVAMHISLDKHSLKFFMGIGFHIKKDGNVILVKGFKMHQANVQPKLRSITIDLTYYPSADFDVKLVDIIETLKSDFSKHLDEFISLT